MIFKKIQTNLMMCIFVVTMMAQLNAQQNLESLGANLDYYEETSSTNEYTNYIPSDPVLKAAEYNCNKPGKNWADSYSVNGKCYCATTFDHNIGGEKFDTPAGKKTVKEICNKIGKGPGKGNNPVYNTVQCGHEPYNNNGDEDPGCCPGRVDQGAKGCNKLGPKWDLSVFKDQGGNNGGSGNVSISVTSVKTDCNFGKARNRIFFTVNGSSSIPKVNVGQVVSKGNGKWMIRHVGAKLGGVTNYTITVGSTKNTKSVTAIKSCPQSAYQLSEHNNEVDIYPNPASKQVTILLNGKENIQVQLISLSGQVVYEQHAASDMVHILLSDYQPGTYIMRFTDNENVTTRTFIIE